MSLLGAMSEKKFLPERKSWNNLHAGLTGGAGNVGWWAGLLECGLSLTLFGRIPNAGSPVAVARPSS